MTYLTYAVFREADRPGRLSVAGPDGAAVAVLSDGDLSAAVSRVPADGLPPTLPRVKAYTQVIASLHAVGAVLPFRYGCFLSDRDAVRALLARRRSAFRSALDRVSGCAEMGVRLLLADQEAEAAPPPPPAEDRSSGTAYLRSRRGHYARLDRRDERARAALEQLRQGFADVCVAFTGEAPGGRPHGLGLQGHGSVLRGGSPHPPRAKGPFSGGAAGAETRRAGDRAGVLVSASFLVRRRQVPAFRELFGRFQSTSAAPALLSGPWPPYSFAGLEGAPSASPQTDYGARSIAAAP